ncbi:DUF916 and DUF3324 domain-containing protein [Latilactobacillus sakei]
MKKRINLCWLLLIGICILINLKPAQAATDQNADFEVQPVFDTSQTNQNLNYYNLKYAPGTTHQIKLRIQNYTEHPVTVYSKFKNAITGVGGENAFTASTKGLDRSLKVPLTSVVRLDGPKKITLKAEEIRYLTATIQMPKENFRGMIYGSWHFIEYLQDKPKDRSEATSNYAYSLGVILQGKPFRVYPELKYQGTTPELYQGHPALTIQLRNTQPMVLNQVALTATVTKQGVFPTKRVYQVTNRVINPNSKLKIPVSWEYDQLKPGKYQVQVKVVGQNYWNHLPMVWRINKQFTVKNTAIKAINQQAIHKPINQWAIASLASGIMLVLATGALIVLIRQRPGI